MSDKEISKTPRKRNRKESSWERNKKKIARNEGREYVSCSGKTVSAKEFQNVESCCPKECCKKIEVPQQKEFFDVFWKSAGEYAAQNYILKGMMTMKIPKLTKEKTNQVTLWDYFFHHKVIHLPVCQKFLCSLLKIDKSRFATVQNKIKNDMCLSDNRGKQSIESSIRLTDEIKKMIQEHCSSIPNSESHYKRLHSSLHYFDNPELTLTKLYSLFVEYYTEKTGNPNPPLSESTYSKYFNHNLHFTFSKPRTDVCDFCFEHKNDADNEDLIKHKGNVEKHKILKKSMIEEKQVLCLEFDFGQNLPLPKIPVSDQFYRRLIWLHVFNVHTFGDEKNSYMYFFLEGKYKKGANTVCNLLYDTIQREFQIGYYNKIYLFSDGCGGQNKNYFVMNFLSLLSEKLQIEIQHLFPVRGHSYCSCDRNFGMYGKKKKKIETIETDEEYYKIIQNARNPPFKILKESAYTVKDFETLLSEIKNPKNLRIRDTVRLSYFPNKQIELFYQYDGKPKTHVLDSDITFENILNGPLANSVGISEEKRTDVKALTKYLSVNGQTFFNDLFDKSSVKKKM